MTEESPVLLNISEMIDLAIGSPEVGVVDFNMLQTVLHCLAQQLRVLGKNVELRGSIVTLPTARDNVQTIAISEYLVDTDDKGSPPKPEMAITPPVPENDTILVVERIKKSESPTTQSPIREHSPNRGTRTSHSPSPQIQTGTEKVSLVTLSKFNLLENAVDDLKNRVYGSMPKNEEILEEVRSQTNLKAITDMWTSLNVSSRLEAAEAGISKLSSLVQDLVTETTPLQEALGKRASPTTQAPQIQQVHAAPDVSKDDMAAIDAKLQELRADVDQLTNTFNNTMAEIAPEFEPAQPTRTSHPTESAESAQPTTPTQQARVEEAPKHDAPAAITTAPGPQQRHPRRSIVDLANRLAEVEKKLKECCESVGKDDNMMQGQINYLQEQVEYITKQMAAGSRDPTAESLSPDLVKDLQSLMKLFETVQEMQEQLKQVHETAVQLAAEKDDRNLRSDALLEQIELLKTIKLDREDMIEAMAEKADLRMLARKVSHDQFDLACDDLSKGLDHALGKLNMQEALWQQALDDIQREIETKLDKMELCPVKDFFNNKLKQLQENLKQMASLRREAEAAGTKRKLLRDVNCISCDAKAVMKMDAPSSVPVSKPLPANLSMKPYLSYELDAIRKAQASSVPQRNMHDWENIDKQMTSKPPHRFSKSEPKHMCNRYCGGSHTVTTAAQRVARLGHFIKQWGPDVLPLSSGLAAGDDGRLYKVTVTERATNGPGGAVDAQCTPQSPRKKSEPPLPPQKPLVIATECRCLDGDRITK